MFQMIKNYQLFFVIAIAFAAGFFVAKKVDEARYQYLINQYQQEKIAYITLQNEKLAAVYERQEQAAQGEQRIIKELLSLSTSIEGVKSEVRGGIKDAIKSDGNGFTGLGAISVQLYERALGYTRDTTNSVSANTRNPATNTPNAGAANSPTLQPESIIKHAVDYGAWCQELKEQLIKIEQWQQMQNKIRGAQ